MWTALRVAGAIVAALGLAALGSCTPAPAALAIPTPLAAATPLPLRGRAYIKLLGARRFDEATGWFGDAMREQLPASKLSATWDKIATEGGHLKDSGESHTWSNGAWHVVVTEARFEHGSVDVTLTLDANERVAGLWFGPLRTTWSRPPYVDPTAFTESDLEVGGEPRLWGTLAKPSGPGPFPVVVLVHGSGPSDRDETSDGTKLFKDLAWGLASRGVAVLRYNKRTYQYRRSLSGKAFTYDEEVVDDACAAVRDAASLPGIGSCARVRARTQPRCNPGSTHRSAIGRARRWSRAHGRLDAAHRPPAA